MAPTYLVVVEVQFPVNQLVVTDLSADEFMVHKNAVNRFKDGVVDGISSNTDGSLSNNLDGAFYKQGDVVIVNIQAATDASLMQRRVLNSNFTNRNNSRKLVNALKIDYYVQLRANNVDPAGYTDTEEFIVEYDALVLKLSQLNYSKKITQSLVTSSNHHHYPYEGINAEAQIPGTRVHRTALYVGTIQGVPTMHPTETPQIRTSPVTLGMLTAIIGSLFMLVAGVTLVRYHKPDTSKVGVFAPKKLKDSDFMAALPFGFGRNRNKVQPKVLDSDEDTKVTDQLHTIFKMGYSVMGDDLTCVSERKQDGAVSREPEYETSTKTEPAAAEVEAGAEKEDESKGEDEVRGPKAVKDVEEVEYSDTDTDSDDEVGSEVEEQRTQALEQARLNEQEAEQIKHETPRVLFVVQGARDGEVVEYCTADPKTVVQCRKSLQMPAGATDIPESELLSKYGEVSLVEDEERDYPGRMEMPVPKHLASADASAVGRLVGSVALPMMQDVVIDIWRATNGGPAWATSTINGVVFAVLERLVILPPDDDDDDDKDEEARHEKKKAPVEMIGKCPTKNKNVTEVYCDE